MKKKPLNIGVVTRYVENFYFGSIIKGIHNVVKQEKGRLFIFNTYMIDRFRMDVEGEEDYYSFSFNHIDGWIIISLGASDLKPEYINKIISTGKPVVMVGHRENTYNCTIVIDDSYNGARNVMEHLLSHGHKRIAYVGTSEIYDMVERHSGYKEILDEHGLYDESIVYDVELPMPEFGEKLATDMIKKGIDFTAIFAANDYLAIGLIKGLKKGNINVPEDIAVIGYDNTDKGELLKPALTSMDQNTFEIGRGAGKTLLRLISGEKLKVKKVKSKLVVRESCGCQFKPVDTEITNDVLEQKNSMIERLEDALYKNAGIGAKLFTLSVSDILKIIPQITDEYKWFCFGLFQENNGSIRKVTIQTVVDRVRKTTINESIECNLEDFPLLELMPDYELDQDDIILIFPVATGKKKVGIMSYIRKINKDANLFVYEMDIVLYNLLGIAIDRNLAMSNLKETLESLKNTQEQLVESEKMASLSNLVTGVAHEINNPIGVGITATTYVENITHQLKDLFETNKLKKSELVKLVEKNNESVKILLMNLQKASNVIKSFKQIAVDNTTEEKRVFKVKEYLNDVILSVSLKLKMKGIKVNLQCKDNLQLYCNPGELSQVFTNLLVNSIRYGYNGIGKGEINIKFEKKEESLVIVYSDDGKGMEKEVLDKSFEPFFTTEKGNGGSGLGLTIIKNIIEQKFDGTIECESEYNKGTTFIIYLPLSLVAK
ncbi:substrate-binding domain-containing protein [Herbivorax sp. ANBcel31]|uniref:substrate-binding domain-containing protein n=1 Tax=Herbivorax sp. ANBcel31 TaxID=3069754 RepID=UPI0027AEE06E|nr:substrate-binding domain-containing protein [Herbivorax sp. ANBcel31]MDQ2087276.1 substrate-binding domain-containing protein [Herbivorax sp. ANBcel31]